MRIEYDAPTNAAYIYLVDEITRGMVKKTRAVEHEGINLDFSGSDTLIGIEVLNARARVPALLLGRLLLAEAPQTAPGAIASTEPIRQFSAEYPTYEFALIAVVRQRGHDQTDAINMAVENLPLFKGALLYTQTPTPHSLGLGPTKVVRELQVIMGYEVKSPP